MKFTKEDREACVPLIKKLVELSNEARRAGILALEAQITDDENMFLRTALEMVIDGCDPEIVRITLSNIIKYGAHTPRELLERTIMEQGVLAIQLGTNPRYIAMQLYAILGEDYLHLAKNCFSDFNFLYQFLDKYKTKEALPVCTDFEEKILELGNRDIQLLERNTDHHWIAVSLLGCSKICIGSFLENLSRQKMLILCEEIERFENCGQQYILDAQKVVVKKIDYFYKTGEMIDWKTFKKREV